MEKFIVIKTEDAERFLPNHDRIDLKHILRQIEVGRNATGKPANNHYAVINLDEPYAKEVTEIMKRHGHWEEPVFDEKSVLNSYQMYDR